MLCFVYLIYELMKDMKEVHVGMFFEFQRNPKYRNIVYFSYLQFYMMYGLTASYSMQTLLC